MNDRYTFFQKSWSLRVYVVLTLGVCFFYFFNSSRVLAIDANSPLFQQNPVGLNGSSGVPQQPMTLPEAQANPSPSIFSTFVHLILALALTVGLIFVTVWGLKQIWEKRGLANTLDENKPIKLLTSAYLAPRKAIHLVEVGNRILVLGVGNDEITRLDVITEPAEIEAIHQSTQAGFPNILERLIHREGAEKTREETEKMMAESNETVGGYVEKLKRAGRQRKDENNRPDDVL